MIASNNGPLISSVINAFTRDNDKMVDQLLQIQYYMRGALSRDDVWQLTPYEREKHVEFLNKRFNEAGDMIKKNIAVFV